MSLLLQLVILAITFYALARIVDLFFIESLEIISKKMKLSSDVAGATFMAIGSSAPELFVSFLALTKVGDQQAIGAGTIVGSAIFNILVIIGASALVRRATLTWQPVIRDLLFYIVAIVLLFVTFQDGVISLTNVISFLSLYIVYLFSFKFWKKAFPYETKGDIDKDQTEETERELNHLNKSKLTYKNAFDKLLALLFFDLQRREFLYLFNFGLSVLLIGFFSFIMVESAVEIAHIFGISEVIIGLTILAAGTSIPDLLSSLEVAKMGRGDMAIANAVGSNIFDICIGLGLPWLVIILIRKEEVTVLNENLNSSIILLIATVFTILFILIAKKWEIGRYAGIFLIATYVLYILYQIGLFSLFI